MKLIAFGDLHDNISNIEKIEDIKSADAVIITGDLTNMKGSERAREILEFIAGFNPHIFAQPGNMDLRDMNSFFDEAGINLNGNGICMDDVGLFGAGGSTTTPFGTPNEYSEEELSQLIEQGYSKIESLPVKIFVPHAPPFNTKVDLLTSGMHVGSKSVRNFIAEKQPDLCLTGHIHEARGEDYLGKTKIVNPGMLSEGGYVEVTVNQGDVSASLKMI
jgi:uncharacterized protein